VTSSIVDLWTRAADPEQPAIVTTREALSHRDARVRVDQFAAALSGLAGPGHVIGIASYDDAAVPLLALATLSVGATAFLCHPDLTALELGRICDHEDATAVLTDGEWHAPGWERRAVAGLPVSVQQSCDRRLVSGVSSSPRLHFHTSGTEGRSKAVVRREASLLAEARGIVETLRLAPGVSVLCTVPTCHAYGFGMGFLGMVASGSTLVIDRPHTPRQLLRCLHAHQPDVLVAVPSQFDVWSRTSDQMAAPEALRLCVSSTAPLTARIAAAFRRAWECPLARQYGMSECGPIAIDLEYDPAPSCVGRPYPGVTIRLDATGPEGDREIVVSSPYAGEGYATERGVEAPRHVFTDLGIRTGDCGRWDHQGRLHLTGRRSAAINVHGLKVDPNEIEELLRASSDVDDVAVVGVETPFGESCIAVFVVAAPAIADAAIDAMCREALAPFKRPRRIVRVKEIPRTVTGNHGSMFSAGSPTSVCRRLTRERRRG
jgi:acyl-coenzyme A synthetase/AMP-(fatty) acid ligase